MTAQHSRSPAVVFFFTVVFSLPFGSNTPAYLLLYMVFLLAFPTYVFFATRTAEFSIAAEFKAASPIAFYALVLFGLSSLVSWLMVLLGDGGLEQKILSSVRYTICLFLAFYSFMLVRFFRLHKLSIESFFMALVYGLWVSIAIFFILYFFYDAPNVGWWNVYPPIGGNIRIMAMTISVALLACISALWLGRYSIRQTVVLYLSVFAMSAYLLWTGSRMSLFVGLFAIALLAVLCRVWLQLAWSRLLAIFLLLLLSVPVSESLALSWGGLPRIVNLSSASIEADDSLEKFGNGRIQVWTAAANAVKEKPILGHGPFGYLFYEHKTPDFEHTHNVVLEMLVEWGAIGAGLFFTFLFMLALKGVQKAKQQFQQHNVAWVMAASAVLVLTLTGLADGTYFVMLPSFILATAFAVFPLQNAPLADKPVNP